MITAQQMSENNKILKIKTGSHLYGTATPTSDVDYSGIFIANSDYYFGLLNIGETDNSIVSKDENGKNTLDAVDDKMYEIRNFIRLAMQNNPNIIEQLFVNDKNIMYADDFGYTVLDNANLFPHRGAYDKFIGYSTSQKKKMVIKEKHFSELTDAFHYFDAESPEKHLLEYREMKLPFLSENEKYFAIGDLNFQKHVTLKKVCEFLGDRLAKASNRYKMILKYGFDCKFASHLIRLLLEGEELMFTGEIVFPLTYADLLLDIKSGKYEIGQILEMSMQYEDRLRDAKERSVLPARPKFDEVNSMIKRITMAYFKKELQV